MRTVTAMNYPQCPRPGHEQNKVVRDGTYGQRARQRFRCTGDDGTFHRFVPTLPRTRVVDGTCDQCDNPVHIHEGPVNMAGSPYEVRAIAQALLDVAGGTSYTEAARRVRVRYRGDAAPGGRKKTSVENGQTVADWLNQFGPTIAVPHAETSWPECVVLDSTEFTHVNPKTGNREQLFVVLAAWGYESDQPKGRLWHLDARPTDTGEDWAEFLAALPGRPRAVVCDQDRAIDAGVRRRWGVGRNAVPVLLCEHHLYVNAKRNVAADGHGGYRSPLNEALNTAFSTPEGWAAFCDVAAELDATETLRWVRYWDQKVTTQVARRDELPAHYSTGALELAIAEVREVLERRKWTFRNRERLNLLLALVRLRINRHDDLTEWARIVRQHLDEHGGVPTRPRKLADPVRHDAVGDRIYSLRG